MLTSEFTCKFCTFSKFLLCSFCTDAFSVDNQPHQLHVTNNPYSVDNVQMSWESATIGFWFTDLLDRHAQFTSWLTEGRPNTFWMTGFFNPQGFLTAMRQEITRAHKGWALDTVVLENDVTKLMREDISAPPAEGSFIDFFAHADFTQYENLILSFIIEDKKFNSK